MRPPVQRDWYRFFYSVYYVNSYLLNSLGIICVKNILKKPTKLLKVISKRFKKCVWGTFISNI